eukprot:GHRR01025084.1.p1 GENE.GHRR01025084.1~~GHRR01025084.1.p1  ORF type:complete len:136 (+),score=19.97 GHRR01025084.1:604-1011(+)
MQQDAQSPTHVTDLELLSSQLWETLPPAACDHLLTLLSLPAAPAAQLCHTHWEMPMHKPTPTTEVWVAADVLSMRRIAVECHDKTAVGNMERVSERSKVDVVVCNRLNIVCGGTQRQVIAEIFALTRQHPSLLAP